MKVSLVLATLGRVDELHRFIDGLAVQTMADYELIVVDQNTDERLLPLIAQAQQRGLAVSHLRSAPGLSLARNLGLHQAQGEVIAFPDDDCWYEPDTLAQVAQALQAQPECDGVVACWCEHAQAGGGTHETVLDLERWRSFRDGDASSICLFMRRPLLQRLGGFDERLGLGTWFGAAEETDLIIRALASGARLVRHPAARVHHAYGGRGALMPASPWRRSLRRARGTGALYLKHGLSPAVVLRGLLAPPFKALARRPLAAHLAHGLAASLGRLQGLWRWWRNGP